MHHTIRSLLIASLLLPGCRMFTPEPVPTSATVPALTLEALSNAEYHSPDWGTFRLTNGLYERPPLNPGEASSVYTTRLLEPAAFGDLNGDGAPDAVVGLATQSGGTGHFVELAAILNRDGSPQNVDTLPLGDRVVIEEAGIQDGIITLQMRVHGPDDGLCCPSQLETWQFQLQGDHLIRVEPPPSVGALSSRP
jgi:hypothetical protein